ncbi:MAG: hypothetical protein AUI50_06745 [Crenarchaeota archaeon 13_1_40CM_2_52_14]|nr:MAG: hypothetical protein AUI97_08620 [Crenarchaeota archaeon 13_1_40CM_3_52_17]OLD34351.1 MAG: hypothetical protein AUI50_06745 [Crenarchaeota archaeon 13_1_40CM_2_52_14]
MKFLVLQNGGGDFNDTVSQGSDAVEETSSTSTPERAGPLPFPERHPTGINAEPVGLTTHVRPFSARTAGPNSNDLRSSSRYRPQPAL